ncbi:hypothetical protein [Streptomyces sp. KL116D]
MAGRPLPTERARQKAAFAVLRMSSYGRPDMIGGRMSRTSPRCGGVE